MYNSNAVYNFEMFEGQAKKIQKAKVFNLPDPESRRKKKYKEKLKVYLTCFSTVLTLASAIGGLLFGQAKLVEYNSKIAISACELEEVKSTNEQLEIKLNAVVCDNNKSFAEDKCVEVITVAAGDKAEIK